MNNPCKYWKAGTTEQKKLHATAVIWRFINARLVETHQTYETLTPLYHVVAWPWRSNLHAAAIQMLLIVSVVTSREDFQHFTCYIYFFSLFPSLFFSLVINSISNDPFNQPKDNFNPINWYFMPILWFHIKINICKRSKKYRLFWAIT